ncbi:MAG: hypothetical protein AAGA18_03065 [Verrucomicrobiota bacterium]
MYIVISAFIAFILASGSLVYQDFITGNWKNLTVRSFAETNASQFLTYCCAYVAGLPFVLIVQIYYLTKPSLYASNDTHWFSFWFVPSATMHLLAFIGIAGLSSVFPFSANLFARPLLFAEIYNEANQHYLYKTDSELSSDLQISMIMESHHVFASDPISWKDKSLNLVIAEGIELELENKIGLRESISTIPFFLSAGFTVIGWVVYCLLDLMKRVFLRDLYPMALYSYSGRFIFVCALAIVMAPIMFSSELIPPTLLAAMCFLIPFYPKELLQFVRKRFETIFSLQKQSELEENSMSLSKLDGMNDYFIFRFEELGIANVQNLCFCDVESLLNDMGYQRGKVIDFIGQGLLKLYVQEEYLPALRTFGVRTVYDFVSLIDKNSIKGMSAKTNIQESHLSQIHKILTQKQMRARVDLLMSHQEACISVDKVAN